MSAHTLFVANLQYERFSGSPAFGPRVATVASMIADSGADCLAIGEAGYAMCQRLADKLGGDWQYDRAQGKGRGVIGEGLNSVWTRRSVWEQPESEVRDYNLNSYGQWQRTLPLAKVFEMGDATAFVTLGVFHWAAKGAPLGVAGADRAKLVQVKQTRQYVGDRRVLLAGDFPRTLSDDDQRYLIGQGFKIWGRTSATPLCAITRNAVRVTAARRVPHGRAFDHDAQVIDFTIPTKAA